MARIPSSEDRPRRRPADGEAPRPRERGRAAAAGLAARQVAARVLDAVLIARHPFDEEAMAAAGADALSSRDRAFARLLIVTVLRRLGRLDAVLGRFVERSPPRRQAHAVTILRLGAAQLLFLGTPAHAAVGLAVEQCRKHRELRGLDGLINAVLRRVAREGVSLLEGLNDPRLDMPGWLLARWEAAYGAHTARRIAEGSLAEPALDLTVRGDATGWAQRLGGVVLPTGSVRLAARGRIEELAGFAQGAWWVQDAAAAIPARMLGEVAGRRVADLCAAPGGKTAQLASAGARVTAVDLSPARLARLRENLARVQLAAETVEADIETWRPAEPFDAVLLDAPCSATGTIRRHPDLPHVKSEADVAAQAAQQAKLLDAAAAFVAPGGRLVYCTCSLEPEEGPAQAEAFLARHPDFLRLPVDWTALGVGPEMVDAEGALRTLPFHGVVQEGTTGGMDGFYAVLLGRKAA